MNLGQEIDAMNQWASEKGSTIKKEGFFSWPGLLNISADKRAAFRQKVLWSSLTWH
jgi:hypothetical protein